MRRFLFLLGLRWLPVGLMIPVLVLLPMERGLSIAQIGVAASMQGIVVLLLELPTGGLSDAIGRRPVLLLAGLLNLGSLAVLTVADTVPLLMLVYLLQGVFRALDSGPLEAWYVDRALADDPDADIETGLSRSGVVLGVAISGGALLGGAVVAVSSLLAPVLLAIGFGVANLVAIMVLLTEERSARGMAALIASAKGVPAAIGGALRLARRNRVLAALIAVELFWGFGMPTFETLMPVRLSGVLAGPDAAAALMGPVGAGGWAASAVGAALVPLLIKKIGTRWTGFALRIAQGLTIVGMAVLAGPAGIIAAYLFCYAMHGAANPVHAALLHRQVDGPHRAGVLSLNSMMSQPGFAIGIVTLTAIAAGAGTAAAMAVGAVVLALAAPLYLVHGGVSAGGGNGYDARRSALTPGGQTC
ncbi:MFS transporter [Actinoplanes sp. NPDC089786]|uniref:MFS transporter n=1 Tax=Actinoplanes sp. NPDC089786 TaxID=3155185 RepID=UPI00343BB8CE